MIAQTLNIRLTLQNFFTIPQSYITIMKTNHSSCSLNILSLRSYCRLNLSSFKLTCLSYKIALPISRSTLLSFMFTFSSCYLLPNTPVDLFILYPNPYIQQAYPKPYRQMLPSCSLDIFIQAELSTILQTDTFIMQSRSSLTSYETTIL